MATTATVAQAVPETSWTDLFKAFSGLAIPATALIVLLIVAILVPAVIFGGFVFEGGYSKFSLKLRKDRANQPVPVDGVSALEPAAEELAPPPPPALEIGAQATPPNADGDDVAQREIWSNYFKAKSVAALDDAYLPFKAEIGPGSEEFWETEHWKRRAELGSDNGVEGMRQLAMDNPTWAHPHAVLLEWAVRDHDLVGAASHLNEGLKRQASPQFGYVLSGGVKLKNLTGGAAEALRFSVEYSKSSLPERIRAGAFFGLAEILKESGNIEGQRIALEWATGIQPYDENKEFTLAYSYAEANSHWGPAMWHYRKVLSKKDDGPVARNNIGILLGNFDKAAQIEAYEKAAAAGDVYAPANLANLLIADGYVAAGERLLKSVEDAGQAAELHSRATAAAMAARREMDKKSSEIERTVDETTKPFRKSVARSFKRLQNGGEAASGFYASEDNLIAASLGPDGASIRLRIGFIDYEGMLKQQTTCFAGFLANRSNTLLSSFSIEATLLDEGGGILRLFQWPNAIGLDYHGSAYELRKVDVPPPPPPPPSLPQSPPYSGIANLLALGLPPVE